MCFGQFIRILFSANYMYVVYFFQVEEFGDLATLLDTDRKFLYQNISSKYRELDIIFYFINPVQQKTSLLNHQLTNFSLNNFPLIP